MSLPSGYKRLEYIQSSGTQYIDTGFTANQNTSATIKFSTTQQSGGGILVAMQGWQNRGFGIFVNAIIFGSSTTDRNGMFGDGNIHEVTLTSAKCYDNGSLIWSGTASTFTTPATLTICKSNVVSEPHEFSSAKIYSCQIYDNGSLVRDYVPCINNDGTIGLWEDVNSAFYGNAGTGTFTAGPEVGVATPENFRLSSSTETTATLAWSAVDGATGYKLYRDGILIATLTDTSYTDIIQPFTSYIYTLTAYNGNGESDPASISVQIIIPPETPSNFRASSASMTAISLAWDAVAGADSYQLKRNGSVIYSGEGTSYTDSGLTAETSYTYTLSAVNTTGSSAETMLEAATTQLILVTDRTQADVTAQNDKGTYNAGDLNRVGAAVEYIAGRFTALGYACPVKVKKDWLTSDAPTASQMEAYRQNIVTLRSRIAVMQSTPEAPASMAGLNYVKANNIEQILLDLDALITNITKSWYFSGEVYAGEV